MGTYNSQELNDEINSMFSVVNTATTSCVTSGNQQQVLNINCAACRGPVNVYVSDISFDELAVYNTNCQATVRNITNIQQEISRQIKQTATAISQQFSLSVAANNQVTNLLTNITTNITNATATSCVSTVAQSQGLNIYCPRSAGPDGSCGTINVSYIKFKERFQPYADCLLNAGNNAELRQQISDIVQQAATAKIESIFGPLGTILIIILIVVGVIFYKGEQAITDWRLWVVVIAVVLLYLPLAYWRHWFPFEQRTSSSTGVPTTTGSNPTNTVTMNNTTSTNPQLDAILNNFVTGVQTTQMQ